MLFIIKLSNHNKFVVIFSSKPQFPILHTVSNKPLLNSHFHIKQQPYNFHQFLHRSISQLRKTIPTHLLAQNFIDFEHYFSNFKQYLICSLIKLSYSSNQQSKKKKVILEYLNMYCQQQSTENPEILVGKGQCHISIEEQDVDFNAVQWCDNKMFTTHKTTNSIADLSIEEDMMKQHQEVIRESFSNYISWCRKRFEFMNVIGQRHKPQLTQIQAENVINNNRIFSKNQKKIIIDYVEQNSLFFELIEFGFMLSKNLLDQIVYVMYKISLLSTKISQQEDLEDQTDLIRAIQTNIDSLTYEILQHPNFSSLVFNNKEYVLLQFTKMIQKWFYTALAIKQDYFTNKYFIQKRKQSPSQGSQLNNHLLQDLQEEDFIPERRKKIKSKY